MGIPTSKTIRTINNISESQWKDGYDSDGKIGPFSNEVLGVEDDDFEAKDAELPISMLSGLAVLNIDIPQVDKNGKPTWYLTHKQMDALKVNELKKVIESWGLKPKGKKADLVKILQDCELQKISISELPVDNVDKLFGFPVGARWKPLSPSSTRTQDSVNEFNFTTRTDDLGHPTTLPKMNDDERRDRSIHWPIQDR